MTRGLEELKRSRLRLKTALDEIQKELSYVEAEIKKLIAASPLNDRFFWTVVFPLLETKAKGMSAADMQKTLTALGNPVNYNAFSTFLSRNKKKGRLTLNNDLSPPRWALTPNLENPLQRELGDK